jgi:hypothetical protein
MADAQFARMGRGGTVGLILAELFFRHGQAEYARPKSRRLLQNQRPLNSARPSSRDGC